MYVHILTMAVQLLEWHLSASTWVHSLWWCYLCPSGESSSSFLFACNAPFNLPYTRTPNSVWNPCPSLLLPDLCLGTVPTRLHPPNLCPPAPVFRLCLHRAIPIPPPRQAMCLCCPPLSTDAGCSTPLQLHRELHFRGSWMSFYRGDLMPLDGPQHYFYAVSTGSVCWACEHFTQASF